MKSKSWVSNIFGMFTSTATGPKENHYTNISGRIQFGANSIERPIITINETGCLVGVESLAEIPEIFDLQIDYQDVHFKAQARRVRLSEAPLGIDLSFVDLTSEKKTELKKIIKAWNDHPYVD